MYANKRTIPEHKRSWHGHPRLYRLPDEMAAIEWATYTRYRHLLRRIALLKRETNDEQLKARMLSHAVRSAAGTRRTLQAQGVLV